MHLPIKVPRWSIALLVRRIVDRRAGFLMAKGAVPVEKEAPAHREKL